MGVLGEGESRKGCQGSVKREGKREKRGERMKQRMYNMVVNIMMLLDNTTNMAAPPGTPHTPHTPHTWYSHIQHLTHCTSLAHFPHRYPHSVHHQLRTLGIPHTLGIPLPHMPLDCSQHGMQWHMITTSIPLATYNPSHTVAKCCEDVMEGGVGATT